MLIWNKKDGGEKSTVWAYMLEFKNLFSIGLLKFEDATREAYHSHAFDCWNVVIKGEGLREEFTDKRIGRWHFKWRPFVVRREDLHQVRAWGRNWLFTIRGPWSKTWEERDEVGETHELGWGRVEQG